jgi:hypothetical protein
MGMPRHVGRIGNIYGAKSYDDGAEMMKELLRWQKGLPPVEWREA